jgi:hypothetical protein
MGHWVKGQACGTMSLGGKQILVQGFSYKMLDETFAKIASTPPPLAAFISAEIKKQSTISLMSYHSTEAR